MSKKREKKPAVQETTPAAEPIDGILPKLEVRVDPSAKPGDPVGALARLLLALVEQDREKQQG